MSFIFLSDHSSSEPRLFPFISALTAQSPLDGCLKAQQLYLHQLGLGRDRSIHSDSRTSMCPWERQSYPVQQTQPQGGRDPGDPFDFVGEIREWSPGGFNDLSKVSLSTRVIAWMRSACLADCLARVPTAFLDFLCCIMIQVLEGTFGLVWLTHLPGSLPGCPSYFGSDHVQRRAL